jgi:aarF domain-containing kinase
MGADSHRPSGLRHGPHAGDAHDGKNSEGRLRLLRCRKRKAAKTAMTTSAEWRRPQHLDDDASTSSLERGDLHEPATSSRRCCRWRARPLGASPPSVAGPQRVRGKICLALLLACLLGRAAEIFYDFQPLTLAARLALIPIHVASHAQYLGALVAPAVCAGALHAWRQLELPDSEGPTGRDLARGLTWTLRASLFFVALLAVGGDVVARCAMMIYVPWAACAAISRTEAWTALTRLVSTWLVFLPLILEYKATTRWARYAGLDDEKTKAAYRMLHEKYAPRVFHLLAEQGGVFVKIGQMLSMLPAGVLPEEFQHELKKLQATVPPRPGSEVRRLIKQALKRPVESIFARFDDVPVGSASIGQVHRARLFDGREVVIKVQYPEVSRTIGPDFRNCERICWMLDKSRIEEVRDTKIHYIKELDFLNEAQMLQRVASNLKKPFPGVLVPEPVFELCRPTVLVMTFVPGTSLLDSITKMAEAIARVRGITVDAMIAEFTKDVGTDKPATPPEAAPDAGVIPPWTPGSRRRRLRAKLARVVPSLSDSTKVKLLQSFMLVSRSTRNVGVALYNQSLGRLGASQLEYSSALPSFDPHKLSSLIWRVHGHQMLIDGLFSTDPHPGNILVEDKKGTLGLIDFGQVCELGPEARVNFARLIIALAADNEAEIARWHAELGYRTTHMTQELVALTAKIKFGDASVLKHYNTFERYKQLAAADPVLSPVGDCAEGLGRAERLINILRGTSFILGIATAHGPTTVWLDIAKKVLLERGLPLPCAAIVSEGPGEKAADGFVVRRDLHQQLRGNSPVAEEFWEPDPELLSQDEGDTFFDVESDVEVSAEAFRPWHLPRAEDIVGSSSSRSPAIFPTGSWSRRVTN